MNTTYAAGCIHIGKANMVRWGIDGWEPEWFVRGDDLIRERSSLLWSCVGERLDGAWVSFDEDGDWWADAPVVLRFGSRSVVVCAHHACRFSIEPGDIDVGRAFRWCGYGESLQWRESALPSLARVKGAVLHGVGVFEYRLPAPLTGPSPGGWGLNGIELRFDGPRSLAIWNGLDENAIADRWMPGPDVRWAGGVGPGPWS